MKSIMTQEKLIQEIAASESITPMLVEMVLKSAEKIVAGQLSSVTPGNDCQIKLLKGLSIQAAYQPGRSISKGLFQDYMCDDKIKVSCKLTKYYKQKINSLTES